MTEKFATKFIAGSCLVSVLLSPAFSLAKVSKAATDDAPVAVVDLASEDIAILPGNPFHGMIGVLAGIRGWFINDRMQDADFRLQLAGRRAAEVRKLLDYAKDNDELLSKALSQYKASLSDFEVKLKKVKNEDVSSEEGFEMMRGMVGRLFMQLRFMSEVESTFDSSADQATVATINESLENALRIIAERLGANDKSLADTAISVISPAENPAKALRSAGAISKMMVRLAAAGEDEFVAELVSIHDALIAAAAQALQAGQ